MNEEKKPKKKSKVDKLIKGIIIGGAIGSVVGITLAPKSGRETRTALKNTASSFLVRANETQKAAKKGFLRTLLGGIRTLFFGKKKR